MRSWPIFLLALLLAACCPRMTTPVPTTEEGINREAELLVRASLTDRIMENAVALYRDQALPLLADRGMPPEEARAAVDEAVKPLVEAEHRRLVAALTPVYRRYYTAEEIHQLLSFFQSEVARKSLRVSPRIAAESREYVRLWSENFGEEFLSRVEEAGD